MEIIKEIYCIKNLRVSGPTHFKPVLKFKCQLYLVLAQFLTQSSPNLWNFLRAVKVFSDVNVVTLYQNLRIGAGSLGTNHVIRKLELSFLSPVLLEVLVGG